MNKQKDLLILDLDNTLIAAVHKAYVRDCLDYPSDFMALGDTYHVNMRPHLHTFMKYAFKNWRVAIWSVSHLDYVEDILTKCGIDITKFEFIKDNSDCIKGIDRGFDTIHIKDMNTLNEDLARVILIDDKSSSAQNLPDNVIEIPAYISAAQTKDDRLLKLIDFLEEMRKVPDFRSFNKVNWYK